MAVSHLHVWIDSQGMQNGDSHLMEDGSSLDKLWGLHMQLLQASLDTGRELGFPGGQNQQPILSPILPEYFLNRDLGSLYCLSAWDSGNICGWMRVSALTIIWPESSYYCLIKSFLLDTY